MKQMEQKMLASLIEQLREFSTPELCDGCTEFRTMDYQIKPFVSEKKIVGPALTVDVPENDGGVTVEPGDIIVGDCNGVLVLHPEEIPAVLEKAKIYGAVPVPGKGHHWFMLPNGIKFELKEQKLGQIKIKASLIKVRGAFCA